MMFERVYKTETPDASAGALSGVWLSRGLTRSLLRERNLLRLVSALLSQHTSLRYARYGDYAGLVKFLLERNQFETVLSPSIEKKCSILLKRTGAAIAYISDQQPILEVR